jgi:hypothetical protein
MVVAEISLVGWVASAVETASVTLLSLATATAVLLGLGRKVIEMDIVAGVLMLAVAILFVGIALDAARRK